MEISERLVELRKEKGLTQMQLSELSGVSQPVIARAERGTVATSTATIEKILEPLGMHLAIISNEPT